jgi:DNA-binding response OmpR family regulator
MTDEGLRRVAVVVEDDSDIRNLLDAVLTQAGFETYSVFDGLAGVEAVRQHNPTVTTLDVSLPGIDGFEVARRIRAFSSTYIVMLTARNEEIDTLIGLDAGADDYLTKPFRPRELRARIEAMLRRPRHTLVSQNGVGTQHIGPDAHQQPGEQHAAPAQQDPAHPSTMARPGAASGDAASAGAASASGGAAGAAHGASAAHDADAAARTAAGAGAGDAARAAARTAAGAAASAAAASGSDADIDDWQEHNGVRLSQEMRLVERDGERIPLTKTEFELLAHIMSNGRRVVSKSSLAIAARPDEFASGVYITESEHRAVEVHLANLRRKLGDDSSNPRWIETVRGVGYRLADPDRG